MSEEPSERLSSIWQEVRARPAQTRIAPVARILQSLEQEPALPDRISPAALIGIWRTERPPSDSDVECILEEAKMEKYR